jgi:hypothetical protein
MKGLVMNAQKILTSADIAAMRKVVREEHPFVILAYHWLFAITMLALLNGSIVILYTSNYMSVQIFVFSMLFIIASAGATWYVREKMFAVTAPTWRRLYSDYRFQTYAGETVHVEQANLSGHLVTIRFDDGTALKEYTVKNLCNGDGQRHLHGDTECDKTLENISRIRWMARGCSGILRASRDRYRDLPQYLLKLDDGRHVWCSLEEMQPVS